MRFFEIKGGGKDADHAKGKGPMPAKKRRGKHPLDGQLVGEAQLHEAEARIQHAEDEIFTRGSRGAMRVVELLRGMQDKGHEATTLKWDGSPAIIFGRNEAGEFVLSDKSGFNKSTPERATSADQIKDFMLNRGGGAKKDDPDRIAFANNMASIFPLFERAVPKDFRGYFKGDLLYYTTPPVKDGHFVFKPNPTGVDYAIDTKSDLGKKIAKSTTAVVIHRIVDEQGNEGPLKDYDIFQGTDVLVVPPVTAIEPVEVDTQALDQLAAVIKKDSAGIDELLNTETLRANQMTDFPRLLYTYLNSKVDTGLTGLGKDFARWLENSKVSDRKKAKILEYIKKHMNAFNSLWHTVTEIQRVKNMIIDKLDQQDHGVKQSINGQSGGEGYVIAHPEGDIKLVNRAGFTAASRAGRRAEK